MFSQFINQRRKELKMSVDDLVLKSNLPKSTVSKITSGIKPNPTLSTVTALCKALECSIDDAVGFEKCNWILSESEQIVIENMRQMNDDGVRQVVNLTKVLSSDPLFKKEMHTDISELA